MFEIGDASRHRRVLDVDIENGKKNGNALTFAAHEIRFGRGINCIHLAVAGRDDEASGGGRHCVGVAEKIKSEDDEQPPQRKQNGRKTNDQRRKKFSQKSDRQQHEQASARQSDHFQRRLRGFSRVFHPVKINFSTSTCNSAF